MERREGDDATCFEIACRIASDGEAQMHEICLVFLRIRIDSRTVGGREIDRGEAKRN